LRMVMVIRMVLRVRTNGLGLRMMMATRMVG